MQAISLRGVSAGVLAAAALAAIAIAFAGDASAERAAGTAKIKIAIEGDKLDFFGAKSVDEGEKLKVINKTDPEMVGPHTFTLVDPSLMNSREEREKCEQLTSKVCKNVLEAHQVGPPPDFPVGKPNVEKGKDGWDREFTKKRKGDSWFTQERGERETRKVTAEAGETVGYFCIVHPFMRGKFKVK